MKNIEMWLFLMALSSAYYATTHAGDLSNTWLSRDTVHEHLLDIREPVPTVVQQQCWDWYYIRNMIKMSSRIFGAGIGTAGFVLGCTNAHDVSTLQASNLFGYGALATISLGGLAALALDYKLDHDEQRYAHSIDDDNNNHYDVI